MKRNLLFIILLLGQISVNAQSISGKLIDENQNPLPYVNIGIVGLDKGTISSSNGMYKIDISGVDNEEIVRFSMVGYVSIDFKVGDLKAKQKEMLNLTMKEKIIQLPEVVVKNQVKKSLFI